MTITGKIKIVFILLVLVILLLMTNSSYYYQSALLTTSRNEGRSEHSRTASSYNNSIERLLVTEMENMLRHNLTNSQEQLNVTELNNTTAEHNNILSPFAASLQTASLKQDYNTEGGYIVVLDIYEQQTMASGNLLQLQCWARYLNMVVVKPFMKNSNMLTPLDETKQLGMLRMEDTFDMHDWEEYTRDVGYAPLVEWAEFVRTAPRKLIVVQAKYPVLTYVRDVRARGLPFPHPPSAKKLYAEGCKFKFLHSKGLSYLQSRGFVVARTVCLNFLSGDELTMKEIQEHILGEYENEKVSILISEWRGIGENQRFLVQENICPEEKAYREHTKPSARILRDAELYTQQYLSHNGGNTSYVAVMARYEMTGLTKHKISDGDTHAIIPSCLKQTNQGLEVVKSVKHIPQVFLSIDIGKYGSDSFKNKHYFGHLSDMEAFVEKLQGLKLEDWEKTFESVTHNQDSGYIAMLQLVLVTKADCIVFVGGGTFQRHALHLYQELHPNESDRCVRIVEKCTSPYRPVTK
ncbi:uncharacterized protein LOC135350629 [Halichondria panicea]|uniref:uncharacterized protein LOC135350629 n=1 Tax=Halichondria panicea TaxID=6063 RepID=UPI00312B6A4A